jgi:hypothetical protein
MTIDALSEATLAPFVNATFAAEISCQLGFASTKVAGMAAEVILSMKRLQPITALPKPGVVVQRDYLGTPEPRKGLARERSAGATRSAAGK